MLSFFSDTKSRYKRAEEQATIVFNNRAILIGERPFFIKEWFSKGIISIKDLLKDNGQFLSFREFQRKYNCQSNFLNFYQVVSAIPNYLLSKTRSMDDLPEDIYLEEHPIFRLANDNGLLQMIMS